MTKKEKRSEKDAIWSSTLTNVIPERRKSLEQVCICLTSHKGEKRNEKGGESLHIGGLAVGVMLEGRMLSTVALTWDISGLGVGDRIPRGVLEIVNPFVEVVGGSVSDTKTAGKEASSGDGMMRVSG